MIKTRCRKYRLVKKVPDSEDQELLKSAIGAPRSSGNNCRNGGWDGGIDKSGFGGNGGLSGVFGFSEYDLNSIKNNKIMEN